MNIKLPTPSEMPTRLFDLMVQRFQMELFNGFSAPDTALNSWFTEKLEGRTVLRASFTFDYDIAVEGEHLPKVMELMLQTVRGAGWFAEVHNATLDVCEIAFTELSDDEPDEEDERDPDDFDPDQDAGVMLSLDNDGEIEGSQKDDDDSEDDEPETIRFRDDSETELEFEDEDDSEDEDDEEDSTDSDDDEVSEPNPTPTGTRPLVEAISAFGDAIGAGAIDWTDIVELDATTVVLELMRDGKELEIEVAAKFDEASAQDVVFHVTPSEKPTLHFASLSALMAYLKEVYGDATKT